MNYTQKRPLVVFSHIPKTGGSTLRRIIDKQYPTESIYRYSHESHRKWLNQTPSARKQAIRCVVGHCRFGVHRSLARPAIYIALLRDPVERVISTYYYIRSRPENSLHHKVKKMSFRQYILSDDPDIQTPLHNHQTRFLSGKHEPDLKLAKEHARRHFAVLGVTERYPESVFLMKKMLGWNNVYYKKENVNRKRRRKQDIPSDLIRIIERNNALDRELYQMANRSLSRRLAALKPGTKRELSRYLQVQKK